MNKNGYNHNSCNRIASTGKPGKIDFNLMVDFYPFIF